MTPFAGNGILNAQQLAQSWVDAYCKGDTCVLLAVSQCAGLPTLEIKYEITRAPATLCRNRQWAICASRQRETKETLMGIAAYNRGTQAIAEEISREARPVEFEIMERLNALPKYSDAGKPFDTIQFVSGNKGVWAVCPRTGFGFWYQTLPEAIKRWQVQIVGFDCGTWLAEPSPIQ